MRMILRSERGATLVELIVYLTLFSTAVSAFVAMEVFARKVFLHENAMIRATARSRILDDIRWDVQRAVDVQVGADGSRLVLRVPAPGQGLAPLAAPDLVEKITYEPEPGSSDGPGPRMVRTVERGPGHAPRTRRYPQGYRSARFRMEWPEGPRGRPLVRAEMELVVVGEDAVLIREDLRMAASPRALWGRGR